MHWIRGYYRMCLAILSLGLGGSLLILTSWLPIHVKGYHLAMWLATGIARTLLFILNVKVNCPEAEKLRRHDGFVFPNHLSYADILVLLHVTPVRFLAKAEIQSWLIVGPVARAIGCVFVKRDDKKSRAEARAALAQVETFPPVVLFPEGTRGPGGELLPFRYGAFEIVIQGQATFVPCAIIYDPLGIAIWRRGENVFKAVWRLASYRGPVTADVVLLEALQPSPDDDPVQLSGEIQGRMTAVLYGQGSKGIGEQG